MLDVGNCALRAGTYFPLSTIVRYLFSWVAFVFGWTEVKYIVLLIIFQIQP